MKRAVTIGDRVIGPGNPVFLIAEAGLNHNGDMNLALDLIDAAVEAGADAVKFQSLTAAGLMHHEHAAYRLISGLELDREAHVRLAVRCRERGIGFASTPFDPGWVALLQELNPVFIKIASPDIVTVPLLDKVGAAGRPVVLSTGLATMNDVEFGISTLRRAGLADDQLVLLHCVSAYPAPIEAVNLRAIRALEERFALPVGFSDHTLGIEAPVWAVAAGACMIEKHFTLDPAMKGPDHSLSLGPADYRRMADTIRLLEKSLGSGEKVPQPEELPIFCAARRGLMLTRALATGEAIHEADLIAVRPLPPQHGVSAGQFREVIGRRLKNALAAGHMLRDDDLEAGDR